MMDESEARAHAAAWLREHGAWGMVDDMILKAFEHGWLVTFPFPEQDPGSIPELGGMRLIVDKDDGVVHSFPASEPPAWTTREYSERKLAHG